MHHGFRPLLEPPSHRRAVIERRRFRPIHCLAVTLVAILLVITVFGVSAWNVYEHKFGIDKFNLLGGDEVALSEVASDFSVTFCDSFKVSLHGPGQVYLLPHHATVNTSFSDDTSVNIHQLPYREFNVKYVYLLKKSSVNVTACRNDAPVSPDAEIVFIHGDNNFKRWRRNNHCSDCVLDRTKITHDAYCHDTSRYMPRLYREIQKNGKYFLIIFNGRPGPRHHVLYSGIVLSGVFSRTHFDLSDAEKVCNLVNVSSCLFDLPWMSNKDVVVKFKGNTWKDYHDNLTTKCNERVIFWVCLFGILPLVCIFITVTLFGCLLCRRRTRDNKITRYCHKEIPGERTPLLRDEDKQFTNQVPQNEENGRMAIQLTL